MQELLVTWFGATGATVVRYAVALAVVIGLLLLLRWVLRNYAIGGQLSIGRGRQNRLTIVEQIALDQRRRLLLVRRDGVEHLILVGGGNDLVVEPTIIRGVPVGSLGRAARPSPATPASPEDVEPSVSEAPAVATPSVGPASQPVVAARPVPAQRPAPTVEAVRPAFPSHVASEHPKATSIQARLNRASPRVVEAARPTSPSPYIPPEAHRVEPTVSPISPIVADKQAAAIETPPVESKVQEAPRLTQVSEPAPVPDEAHGFDDLARQLDEALKSEIEEMKIEAAAPPAAPQPVIAPEPAPPAEAPRPAQQAASAWLRPRAAQPPRQTPAREPVAQREPAAPREPIAPREPVAPREQAVSREPVATPPPQRSPVRQPAVEARMAEPSVEPAAAPEPVVSPRNPTKPAEVTEEEARNNADFSSLENEMARLLDELAGDSKGKR